MAYPPMPPQQPGYQQPAAPKNGMGTAGLVLGIIGALGGPFIPCIGWVLGILAVIFGGVGTSRVNKGEADNKGAATTGLILGVVAIVLATLGAFFWADYNADLMSQYQ